jgi:hypothetical protein
VIPVVILVALAAVVVLPVVVVLRMPDRERVGLLRVLAVAFGLRLAVALILHATGAWQLTGRGAVTPDEATVDLAARLLAGGDPRTPLVLGGSLHTSWLLVCWAVYGLLWNSLLAIKLLNVVLGTLLLVPVYLLGRELHSERAGRLSAWLVAIFPSAIVWSALAMRESLLALVLAGLVLLSVHPLPKLRRPLVGHVLLVVAMLALLAFTRSYMLPLLAGLMIMAAMLRRSARDVLVSGATFGLALMLIGALPTGSELLRTTVSLVAEPAGNIYNPLSHCDAGSACPATVDPRAAGGDQGRLPGSTFKPSPAAGSDGTDLTASLQSVHEKGWVRAFAIAILAGRPVWRTAEFFLLLQPGVVMWWVLLPFALLGAVHLVRVRRWDGALVTAGYAGAVVVFLAFTGQFIRHHYMLEPVSLVLAAVGITSLVSEGDTTVRLRTPATIAAAALGAAAAASIAASLVS